MENEDGSKVKPTFDVFSTQELRLTKRSREEFRALKRQPICLVLDQVQRKYNLGAIFRLCDAMLVDRLIVCGSDLITNNRKFVQAAQGAQYWVPWEQATSTIDTVVKLKESGMHVVIAELSTSSINPEQYTPTYPLCLVVGNEKRGVCQEVANIADGAISVPMLGMSNSLNVSTATAIILYHLTMKSPYKPQYT